VKNKARSSQLIMSDDGTLYHIHLKKSDKVPPNILIMGADSRVDEVASHFDGINFRHRNPKRSEFYTIAGTYKGVPVAAMSIGIGLDNMETAINELHALFEYDHETNMWLPETVSWPENKPKVNIVRVGTCGTSLPEIPAGALAISKYAIGLDNLGAYYPLPPTRTYSFTGPLARIEKKFLKTVVGKVNPITYCSLASPNAVYALLESVETLGENRNIVCGITTASPGFFGPEGRQIGRISTAFGPEEFRQIIQSFDVDGHRIVNHEMETSILFRLGYEQLGYNVGAICLVVDNLATDEVMAGDEAKERMNICIRVALESLVQLSQN